MGKGPDTLKVLQLALEMNALCVRGNHEDVFVQYYRSEVAKEVGAPSPKINEGYLKIAESLTPDQWKYLIEMPLFLRLEDMNAIIVHAGLVPGVPEDQQVPIHPPSVFSVAKEGLTEVQDPDMMMNLRNVLPDGSGTKEIGLGKAWIDTWNGPETVFFGHDAVRGLQLRRDSSHRLIAVGLDTGACYGKFLTAYVHPTGTIVQQPSHEVYSVPTLSLNYSL